MAFLVTAPPCVIHEDEHLLVVNKPAGLNTHSPSPFAGEGLYEWLRNREPRWSTLATIHRLDKATSGVMVFAKTKLANKSLTDQFAMRKVRKRYLLLTRKGPSKQEFTVQSGLIRLGDKYKADPSGVPAETHFEYLGRREGSHLFAAEPLTGRTHQIRVHAAMSGIPILGDTLYQGPPFARVCLHAEELRFQDPENAQELRFRADADFLSAPALALRGLTIEPGSTSAFRVVNGAADGANLLIDRWGDYLLALSEKSPTSRDVEDLQTISDAFGCIGAYHKTLNPEVAKASQEAAAPKLLFGSAAPSGFNVRENGVQYEISFEQGYSVGLFLDQRENRRRLLTNYVAPNFVLPASPEREVLNTFAYTCGFSVCAALAGARTTSLDLSKKYLEWGQRNFALNQLSASEHDFIYGDVFEWAARLAKQQRLFDLILLDPPTFSRSKSGDFQVERDFGRLVHAILPLLKPNAVLFASTNSQKLLPEKFISTIATAVGERGRSIMQQHYIPQPIDFPISKETPGYLKTIWLRVR